MEPELETEPLIFELELFVLSAPEPEMLDDSVLVGALVLVEPPDAVELALLSEVLDPELRRLDVFGADPSSEPELVLLVLVLGVEVVGVALIGVLDVTLVVEVLGAVPVLDPVAVPRTPSRPVPLEELVPLGDVVPLVGVEPDVRVEPEPEPEPEPDVGVEPEPDVRPPSTGPTIPVIGDRVSLVSSAIVIGAVRLLNADPAAGSAVDCAIASGNVVATGAPTAVVAVEVIADCDVVKVASIGEVGSPAVSPLSASIRLLAGSVANVALSIRPVTVPETVSAGSAVGLVNGAGAAPMAAVGSVGAVIDAVAGAGMTGTVSVTSAMTSGSASGAA